MAKTSSKAPPAQTLPVQILRHRQVREKLQVSSAKLYDMVARGLFPKPFKLIPGGRAVGWLESDVAHWILHRRQAALQFHFAPPAASHGVGDSPTLTNHTDHSVGAGQADTSSRAKSI